MARKSTDVVVVTSSSTTATLNNLYGILDAVYVLAGGATDIAPTVYTLAGATIVTGTPTTGQVQFTGTPQAPSNTLTFPAALAANSVVIAVGEQDGDAA